MNDHPPAAQVVEPAFIDALRSIFEERIVFNRVLGLRIESFDVARPRARITMRDDLVGHFVHQRLHGGVISATLDAIGALAVMLAIGDRHRDEPLDLRVARFGKLGTIDLRVDYLRPAAGPYFLAGAEVMRLGSRVASTQMTLHDASGTLTSTAGAAYIVS